MQELDPTLLDWIREVTGATAVSVERRAGGASRLGFAVDVASPDATTRQLWLRLDAGTGPQSGTEYSLRREAAVYRAVGEAGIRVPALVAVHPSADAFLTERLEGRNWFSELTDPDEARTIATEFMSELAALHRLGPADLDLPELGEPSTIGHHVRDEIAIWRGQYVAQDEPDPLVELALAWLEDHLPPDGDWPLVLVQGDTGPGNFMYADGALLAVMDWEMAHWGDLHDDLAWVCVRDLQERFTVLADRLADYAAALGRPIDLDRLRYFRVLAQARCAIGTLSGLHARDARGEIANHLLYSTLHVRLLAEALAEAEGLAIEPAAAFDDPGDTELTWMYDVALAEVRDTIVPALEDPFATRRAKGLARLLKHLRESDRVAAVLDAAERDELAALLGRQAAQLGPLRDARAELCAALRGTGEHPASVDHAAVLRAYLRQIQRVTQARRPLLGALAERHYSPLETPPH